MRSAETAEEAVLLAEVVVDAGEPHVDVLDVFAGEEIVADTHGPFALAVGCGPVADDVFGDGVNAIVGDAIAREGIADEFAGVVGIGAGGEVVVDDDLAAGGIEGAGEVAGFLFGGGDGGKELIGGAGADGLVVGEEERFFALDAAAEGSAVVVVLEQGFGDAGAVVAPGVGVEVIVAEELVEDAVELV